MMIFNPRTPANYRHDARYFDCYFILLVDSRDNTPNSLQTYSEYPLTVFGGNNHLIQVVVAVSKGTNYREAMNKITRWWRSQKPAQKRAFLLNAFVPAWTPPVIE